MATQRPLIERWTLLAPDRPGHGRSPDARQDFAKEAPIVADQLFREPVHVVGHSYGAIVGALAAARKPELVRSLTLIEPPATRVANGNPVVDGWADETRALFSDRDDDLRALLGRFFRCLVVSGGHHEGYEAVCDVIAKETKAERAVITGADHLVPDTGDPFNRRLEAFLRESS